MPNCPRCKDYVTAYRVCQDCGTEYCAKCGTGSGTICPKCGSIKVTIKQ